MSAATREVVLNRLDLLKVRLPIDEINALLPGRMRGA